MKRLLVLFFLVLGLGCVNKEITKVKDPSKLTVQQVVADMTSGDFQRMLQARTQLARLTLSQKMAVMKQLMASPKPATRLTAVAELKKLVPDSCPCLQKAANDPDDDVKAAAQDALKACNK
jgi:hypothetical protein